MFTSNVALVDGFSVDSDRFINPVVDAKEWKTSTFRFRNITFVTNRVDVTLLRVEQFRIQLFIHTRVSVLETTEVTANSNPRHFCRFLYNLTFTLSKEWQATWITTITNLAALAWGLIFGYMYSHRQNITFITKRVSCQIIVFSTLTKKFLVLLYLVVHDCHGFLSRNDFIFSLL